MDEINREQLNSAIDSLSNQLGADNDKLKNAVNSGSMDKFLKNLKPADAKKLQQILSNKAETERLLKTPQAQLLLKKFLEKNKDSRRETFEFFGHSPQYF